MASQEIQGKQRLNLLVVDRELEAQVQLKEIFTGEGYGVTGLSDPALAANEVRDNRFQLVVLDVSPGSGGAEALAAIRAIDKDICVIATTGMGGLTPIEFGPYPSYSQVERAQLWDAGVAQPAKVLSTDTRPFWRDGADSPVDQGFHWNHNAETLFLIGKALGDNMVNLLAP